jgi:signal transduction histidine kinase
LRRPDGTWRWVFSRAVPARDASGAVERWVGTTVDIDARRRAEDALREADRRKDDFLATLAHELRNPLAPIRNGLEILRLTGAPDPRAAGAQAMMERQLAHLVRLVDDLLDVSRITRGKVELRRERVRVRDVVEHAVETSRPLVEAGRQLLAVSHAGEPLWVDGDLTRLAQVVSNLLNNAARFTPTGRRIDVLARREGDQAVIEVRDEGAGIPAETLPRVFELFAQGGHAADRAGGGLGIGLSLARALCELHGGTIDAASPGPGLGSTFTVRLPLAPAPVPADGAATPAARGRARRVLVVDDNVDAADSLALLLRLGGHEVATAQDGPAAIEAARRQPPEVVFLDIGLPGMDGYEVARRLRADPATAGTRLVALTGWGADEDRRRSHDAGFDLHLTKPVEAEAIERVLAG